MAGFTNAPMRMISSDYGADLTFTEMTSDMGVLRAEPKSWSLLERAHNEDNVVAHLYGSNPDSLAEAARRVEAMGGFAGIDLNAGCPVHKVKRSGAGAALINDPALLYRILKAMRKSTTLPLSLKTRLGTHPGRIAIFDILKAAQDAGVDALAVHARFTSQGHGGEPDLELLARVKAVATIPVIGNGGIRSAWDAWRMLTISRVDALMIARCAIGNPWIFNDIRRGLESEEPPEIYEPTHGRTKRDLNELHTLFLRHLNDENVFLSQIRDRFNLPETALSIEKSLATTFRCHLFRYLHGLKGSSYLRSHLNQIATTPEIIAAVESCIERERAFRIAGAKTHP